MEQLPSLPQSQSRGTGRQSEQAEGASPQGIQRTPVEAHDGQYALRCRGGRQIGAEIPGPQRRPGHAENLYPSVGGEGTGSGGCAE